MVRVALAGRRVGGWVVATDVDPPPAVTLRPLAHRRGWGPEPAVVDLAGWAAWRWAGRRAALLRTASPLAAVRALPPAVLTPPPPPRLTGPGAQAVAGMVADALGPHRGGRRAPSVVRLPARHRPDPGRRTGSAQHGPTLVVVPTSAASHGPGRRACAGLGPAWPSSLTVGPGPGRRRRGRRSPGGGLGAVPRPGRRRRRRRPRRGLHQEQNPTWDAVDRRRRAGPSGGRAVRGHQPVPDPGARWRGADRGRRPRRRLERDGWASIEVVDRRGDDPRLGLYSEPLVALVRGGAPGGVRAEPEGPGPAPRLPGVRHAGPLRAVRVGHGRGPGPRSRWRHRRAASALRAVRARPARGCAPACGSTALRQLRVGVSPGREELESLAGRPVGEVTAATPPATATRPIWWSAPRRSCTGAAGCDAVAFLDFDSELLAPRFRAGEEALGAAGPGVAARRWATAGGRVLVQTRVPDHPVIDAAVGRRPGPVASAGDGDARRSLAAAAVRRPGRAVRGGRRRPGRRPGRRCHRGRAGAESTAAGWCGPPAPTSWLTPWRGRAAVGAGAIPSTRGRPPSPGARAATASHTAGGRRRGMPVGRPRLDRTWPAAPDGSRLAYTAHSWRRSS